MRELLTGVVETSRVGSKGSETRISIHICTPRCYDRYVVLLRTCPPTATTLKIRDSSDSASQTANTGFALIPSTPSDRFMIFPKQSPATDLGSLQPWWLVALGKLDHGMGKIGVPVFLESPWKPSWSRIHIS